MPRQRWTVELLGRPPADGWPQAPALLRVEAAGAGLEARLLSVEPEGAAGCSVVWGPPVSRAALEALAEVGVPEGDLRVAALASRSAHWWEEHPADCAEADLLRAALALAALRPDAAARALAPWSTRPVPGLLLSARLHAAEAEAALGLGEVEAGLAAAERALGAVERRPARCPLGDALAQNMRMTCLQLALERPSAPQRLTARVVAAVGPEAAWRTAPVGQSGGAMIAELGLLRLILSQPTAYSALRAAWLKLEARWAPRGPTLMGRRVNLLRGLLCAEEGMPLEARARWAAAAAPGGGPRCRLVAVCAQRFHEADGPSLRAEARALAAEAPLAATALAAVEVAAVLAPGRARFAALPLWVR